MDLGFEYCVNQTLGGWCPTEKLFHLNRRRRWYRTRVIKGDQIPDEKRVNLFEHMSLGKEMISSGKSHALRSIV